VQMNSTYLIAVLLIARVMTSDAIH
jgi:hypothetical protein